MTDKCPICFDELRSDIGALPCGHCIHKSCWAELTARLEAENEMSDDDSKVCPTCPICKRKANKINDIFLTFESPADENDTRSSVAEQAVANLTGENMRLQKRLREMKTSSKDQSELLSCILPLHKDLEERFSRLRREKKKLEQHLHEMETEKSDLKSDKSVVDDALSRLKEEKHELELKLQDSNEEIMDLHHIWNQMDEQLLRAKKKRQEAKIALKEKEREQNEQKGKLIMARDELFRARQEKQELEQQMEHSRIEATRLKKRMNKVMNRKRTLQKKKNGKSYRRVAPKVKTFDWLMRANSAKRIQSWRVGVTFGVTLFWSFLDFGRAYVTRALPSPAVSIGAGWKAHTTLLCIVREILTLSSLLRCVDSFLSQPEITTIDTNFFRYEKEIR